MVSFHRSHLEYLQAVSYCRLALLNKPNKFSGLELLLGWYFHHRALIWITFDAFKRTSTQGLFPQEICGLMNLFSHFTRFLMHSIPEGWVGGHSMLVFTRKSFSAPTKLLKLSDQILMKFHA